LTSPDDIINLASDGLHLLLPIKSSPNLLIGFNETLQLLLQAVVLIVQVSHVLIKSIYLCLQLNLILIHLL